MITVTDCSSFYFHDANFSDQLEEDDSASKYLDFANADLTAEDSERARVNAISNAKRALHRRVEIITTYLGFEGYPSQKKDFPNKIAFCRNCGVATPRILEKLNKLRNRVEHEYYSPTQSESQDFVDVVALFLAATQRLVDDPPESIFLLAPWYSGVLSYDGEQLGLAEVIISFDSEHKKLELRFGERDASSEEKERLERERARKAKEAGELYLARSGLQYFTQTISASEGQVFCEWMTLMISKSRGF